MAACGGFVFADSITGVVTNKTTNKPSAGDDVVLIRLAQGGSGATHRQLTRLTDAGDLAPVHALVLGVLDRPNG